MQTLVVYDIPSDRARGKIADVCQDYGLDRIQYSAFLGDLQRTHQEELLKKIGSKLGKRPGKVHLFTMCEKDWRLRLEIVQEARENDGEEAEGQGDEVRLVESGVKSVKREEGDSKMQNAVDSGRGREEK